MKCLAVNTANSMLSVALTIDGLAAYEFSTPETRDQGNLLLNHATQALQAAGIGYGGLDLLAVVTGPGSFTGIRIGIAAMRGMALAAKLPLVGVTSFELYAAPRDGFANIIAVESWREELYLQLDDRTPVNVTSNVFVAGLSDGHYVISGDAAAKVELDTAHIDTRVRTASDVATIAVEKFMRDGAGAPPLPYYLRDADVTISTKTVQRVLADN
jgi:tRNA threonylcarbamoyladenosine biosynthesis protein TsaB